MRYEMNYRETGSFLKGRPLNDATRRAADDVAEQARQIVTVEAYETGALLASIGVEPSPSRDRVGWAVVADDPAAAPTEFGNERVPADEVEHFLTRAAREAGLDVRGVEA